MPKQTQLVTLTGVTATIAPDPLRITGVRAVSLMMRITGGLKVLTGREAAVILTASDLDKILGSSPEALSLFREALRRYDRATRRPDEDAHVGERRYPM